MKKTISLILTVVLLAGLLTGCGNSDSNSNTPTEENTQSSSETEVDDTSETDVDNSSEADADSSNAELKSFVLASHMINTGIPRTVQYGNNVEQLAKLAGGSVTFPAVFDFTPDGVLTYVESQIAAGVDGLFICPPAESILPTITQLCEEAGIYWGITLRSIEDDEIRNTVESSSYYVGNCYENEEEVGYQVMKYLNDLGYKKVAIISQPVGDKAGDRREVGINQACEEFGMEIVAEARGMSQASDCASATESFLAAAPDLDVVYCVALGVAGGQEAVSKAIQDAGRDVKVATIDWPTDMIRLFEEEMLVVAASSSGPVSTPFDSYFTALKVINAIQGYPIEGGESFENTLSPFLVTDIEGAEQINAFSNNENYMYFSDDYIQETLFKWNNSDLSQDNIQKIIDGYNPFQ